MWRSLLVCILIAFCHCACAQEQSVFEEQPIAQPRRYRTQTTSSDPPSLQEVEKNITTYLHTLHARLEAISGRNVDPVVAWETFLEVTRDTVMKWDDENKHRYFSPRQDGSIFVGLCTYRDPFCPMTLKSLFAEAKEPRKLYIGLFQQNCFGPKCRTGVLKGGIVEDAPPDDDCYKLFCASPEGIASNACNTDQIRLFNVNESESLGPYMARYLGAKFYRGENYYLQIDSHSEFVKHWDAKLIEMMHLAPAKKPVISAYPPDSHMDWRDTVGYRMCDSEFASAQIEWQIIRLGPSGPHDHQIPAVPCYAPFVAAGFYFTTGEVLREVPFDPLMPWIFMGEEISMSSRLWTSGYDIFSPTTNVLDHYYVRRHYPKFWESVNRFFKSPIHNPLVEMVIMRTKHLLGYPESATDLVSPLSVLYRAEDWGMGNQRSYDQYAKMVGLDFKTKVATPNRWCVQCKWPEEAKPYFFKK